jgi:DNA-binding response OmpR family regulator
LQASRRVRPAVLIADDDPPLLHLLRRIVARHDDLDVVTCRDGDEAIRELAERHFDVVLLDLMMPRRNGFEVLDFLREHRPEQLRVVLVLTAATDQFTARLDPSVVHALVAKPFDCDELGRLVQNIVEVARLNRAGPPLPQA